MQTQIDAHNRISTHSESIRVAVCMGKCLRSECLHRRLKQARTNARMYVCMCMHLCDFLIFSYFYLTTPTTLCKYTHTNGHTGSHIHIYAYIHVTVLLSFALSFLLVKN